MNPFACHVVSNDPPHPCTRTTGAATAQTVPGHGRRGWAAQVVALALAFLLIGVDSVTPLGDDGLEPEQLARRYRQRGMAAFAQVRTHVAAQRVQVATGGADLGRAQQRRFIAAVETQLNCLEVFALGGRSKADDGAESSYWTVRAALGQALNEAAVYISRRGVVERTAPAIARLLSAVASRFGVVVSEQAAVKAIPDPCCVPGM